MVQDNGSIASSLNMAHWCSLDFQDTLQSFRKFFYKHQLGIDITSPIDPMEVVVSYASNLDSIRCGLPWVPKMNHQQFSLFTHRGLLATSSIRAFFEGHK